MPYVMILLLVLFSGCSSIVILGVDKADNFSIASYKSFNFYEINKGGDAIGPDYEANLDLLKAAITKQLNAKGVILNEENPELLVNIGIVISEKVQTRETNFANPGDRTRYMGQRSYSWRAEEVEVGRYRQGTVTVHLVDKAENKLVWKGSAESAVPEKQKKVPAAIEEGMTKLFSKIP